LSSPAANSVEPRADALPMSASRLSIRALPKPTANVVTSRPDVTTAAAAAAMRCGPSRSGSAAVVARVSIKANSSSTRSHVAVR